MKKKFINKLLITVFSASAVFAVASCGDDPDPTVESKYEYVEGKKDHHLIFSTATNASYSKMVVYENDTWDSLQPYFPLCPLNSDGLEGSWAKPKDGVVYNADICDIIVCAVYSK